MTTGTGDRDWQEVLITLARAQARTEEQFAALAAAQSRTDERLEALAAAQTRTDEQLAVLTRRVDDLAVAQVQTEQRLTTLTERVDVLTARVDTLAEQMIVLTARVDALTIRVDALTEQMIVLTARVDALTVRVDALTVRVDALTEQMTLLTARVDALTEQMAALVVRVDGLNDKVGELTGWSWEARYRDRAHAYLGRLVRHVQVLPAGRLASVLDAAVASGELSEDEMDEIERADLICSGRRREDGTPAYLVVEVSAGVGLSDVQRAARRADLLARTGTPALAVVAGQRINPEAEKAASVLGVWQVNNGKTIDPSGRMSASAEE